MHRKCGNLTLFLEVIQYCSWFMLWDFVEYASSVSPGIDFRLLTMITRVIFWVPNNCLCKLNVFPATSVLTHAEGVLDSFASVTMRSNLGLLREDSVDLMCSTSDVCSGFHLHVFQERPSEDWYKLNADATADRH